MSNRKIRILLADDHSLLRMGLASLLGYQPDLQVVGEAEDGRQAIDLACRLKPDLVIMDLMMPVVDGATATAEILAAEPRTKVLVLTSFGTSDEVVRAIRNGATGVILKDEPNDELLAAIRATAAGQETFSNEVRQLLAAANDRQELTARQLNMLKAASEGLTTDAIASRTGITPDGVKKHFTVIFHKLGASSRSEAIAIAIKKRLLKI